MSIAEAEALYTEAERLYNKDTAGGGEPSEITQVFSSLVLNRLEEAGTPAALIGADRLTALRSWAGA